MARYSIGRRLMLGFGILICCIIVTGLVSYYETRIVIRELTKITDKEEPKSAAAYQMEIHAIRAERSILKYLIHPDRKSREMMVEENYKFREFLDAYASLAENSEEQVFFVKIDNIFMNLSPVLSSLLSTKDYQNKLLIDLADRFDRARAFFQKTEPGLTDLHNSLEFQKYQSYIGMKTEFVECGNWLGHHLHTGNPVYSDYLASHIKDFLSYLNKFKSFQLTLDEKSWVKEVDDAFSDIHSSFSEITGIESTFSRDLASIEALIERLHMILYGGVVKSALNQSKSAKRKSIHTVKRAKQIDIGVIIIGIVMCGVIIVSLTLYITKSFNALISATERLGEGRLSERITINRRDEFGRLGEAFNKMSEDLEKYIAEKTLYEKSFQESDMLFINVFESFQDGIVILDRDFTIRRSNSVFKNWYEAIFNFQDRACYECFQHRSQPCETCPAFRCIESGRTEMDVISGPPGSPKKWIELYAHPLRDQKSGAVSGIILYFHDITSRKQDEEEKQLVQKRYELILKNASEAIFVSQEGLLKYANPYAEKLIGYAVEEMEGVPLVEFVHPDDRSKMLDRYKKIVTEGKELFYTTLKVNSKSGKELLLEIHSVLIDWENQPAILSFAKDITEIQKMENKLIQSQKIESIGTLAGGIAHDFNNILYPIVGYTELSMAHVPKEGKAYGYLDEILRASMRARDLVQQILTFSRDGTPESKPLMAQLVVKEALKLLRASIPKTIEIQHEINRDCGLIMGDPTQIHQIVMNLCTNAYHAMENTGGRIDVSLSETELCADDLEDQLDMAPGRYLRLSVGDNGKGIPPEIIDRIFDPYFTTKEQGKGTGLGLSVTHGIVKQHGGMITVYSELGKGTTFRIYLPMVDKHKNFVQPEVSQTLPTGTEKILLVDDEDAIARIEQHLLEHLGYKVTTRTSSVEALEAFRKNPDGYDLVVTDLTMPNMTGDQLARKLVKIRADIPVLVCTGFSEQVNQEKARAAGIKGMLMKPVVRSELAKAVRQVLDD